MGERRKRALYRRVVRGAYAGVVCLAALVVVLWCGWRIAAREPEVTHQPVRPAPRVQAAASTPQAGPVRKEATWTFLLCARDQVSGSADTIMVCTYDTRNQRAGLVSIPRDTLVDRRVGEYHYYKLNAALTNGDLAHPPNGGVAELRQAVSELLGIPIDHYVKVDTRMFVELVDALGGVDFDVPVYMNYDAPDQDLHIHFQPGLQHLTGEQALAVARCRKNSDGKGRYPYNIYDAYPDADIGRTRTQQALLRAIGRKALSQPQNIERYAQLITEYVETDLSLSNLLWLAGPALHFDMEDLATATLPGDGSAQYQGIEDLYELDREGCLAIINDCLNPYTTPVTGDRTVMVQCP